MIWEELVTAKAQEYRETLQKKLKASLWESTFVSGMQESMLVRLRECSDLFRPVVSTVPDVLLIDTLCAMVRSGGTNVAMLHCRGEDTPVEGLGRTSLMLRLLGLRFAYSRLRQNLPMEGSFPLSFQPEVAGAAKFLHSDFAYLGAYNGNLVSVPPAGEPLIALWDITRHLLRMLTDGYHSGLRLRPEARTTLWEILKRLPVNAIIERFGGWKNVYPIDIAVILEFDPRVSEPVLIPLNNGCNARSLWERAFGVVLQLETPFWDRDSGAHMALAKRVLDQLVALPKVFRIGVNPVWNTLKDKERYTEALANAFREAVIV